MWKDRQRGVRPLWDSEGGRGPRGLHSSLPLTLLLQAAPSHLPPGTQHCYWERGMRQSFGHSAGVSNGKRPWPGSQPQGPCPTLSDCCNSLPLSGSCFSPWEMRGLGAMASVLPSTPTRTEARAQHLVRLWPCHGATPIVSRDRGIHLPVSSQLCLPAQLGLQGPALTVALQFIIQSFRLHTWNNKSNHKHFEITL